MKTETRWDVGEMVVVHTLNDLVGEITKRALNGDGEYDYTLADSTKAKEILNWNPTLEIKNHISKVISDKD